MEGVQSIYEPLYSILRIVDTEVVPIVPILYDTFHIMKENIYKLKGKKWILKIINHKWDVTLSCPLHQAGNLDAVIAQHAAQEGLYVDRVIFEDVRSGDTSSFEMDMLGPRQGQRHPLSDNASTSRKESSSNSSDNDGRNNDGLEVMKKEDNIAHLLSRVILLMPPKMRIMNAEKLDHALAQLGSNTQGEESN
ncbi:unnamed protein product [Prunus armeniaca]|uniref:Uncharacterized protein n=1 Tax=Prunus armeniaca TaxID=36596 RepID=A0A6J5UCS4_PRUAR|nr:unnamed protein product [Prunus armeniaca]